jgi:chromosome segregation ATPase
MGEAAATAKDEAAAEGERGGGAARSPLYWGLAVAMVIISAAVAYRIVKSDGQVDVKGGLDGIQVKITEAQKTIASAQQEVTDAQRQLDAREAALTSQQQALHDREAKVQELLARLDKTDKTTPAPSKLTAEQAQLELKSLRATPISAGAAPEPLAVKSRIEKLDRLKATLGQTSVELKAAAGASRDGRDERDQTTR